MPTRLEAIAFATYPALLLLGSLFSLLSPETRSAPYDPVAQAHVQDPALVPSYFARKDNIVNRLFVKQGWFWMTAAALFFALTHPSFSSSGARRARALLRFAAVTAAWVLVTQWFFGPALIDRGFTLTGGGCDAPDDDLAHIGSAAACKRTGGRWKGGHDISGHVFLLVLGSGALLQEVGWVLWLDGRAGAACSGNEERFIVMSDGAARRASVEASGPSRQGGSDPIEQDYLDLGAKFATGIVALSGWMILMTAIYFHTWFEKITGLLVALFCLYAIYILPRSIPALRAVLGQPGI